MGISELITELKRSWWESKFPEAKELAKGLPQGEDCINKFARKVVVTGNPDTLFDTLKQRIEELHTPHSPRVKLVDVNETENNYVATVQKVGSGYSLATQRIELQKHNNGVDIMQSNIEKPSLATITAIMYTPGPFKFKRDGDDDKCGKGKRDKESVVSWAY
jgi:hypothetical protein